MESLKGFSVYTPREVTAAQSYAAIRNAESLGLDESALIECGGAMTACHILQNYPGKRVLVVCGIGGKGATGMSLARHLQNHAEVAVAVLGARQSVSKEVTRKNLGLLENLIEIEFIEQPQLQKLKEMLARSQIVVDAIFGIGMKGRISGIHRSAINAINGSRKRIISIDVPTGIDPDSGLPNTVAVNADEVLALHKNKSGLMKGRSVKKLTVIDIGVPITAELFTGPGDIMVAVRKRGSYFNKYSNGSVLVVGGSPKYSGAPILASYASNVAFSSLRGGVGYVTILVPKGIASAMKLISPNLIVRSFDESDPDALVKEALGIRHNALVLGPGMEAGRQPHPDVHMLLEQEKKIGNIVVVDGGALPAVAEAGFKPGANAVLTPHDGEFGKLTGKKLPENLSGRARAAIDFAAERDCTLVLKGHDTIITDGKILKINSAGTPALATMGTGDVLAGLIGAYAAMSGRPFESAVAAVGVHSGLGDMLYKSRGNHIIAQDLIEALPSFLKDFDA